MKATTAQWIQGARPRTLPAAVAPVLVGSAAAQQVDAFVWWKAALALGVALCLQIGVNYANDYSDGIRGTDAERVGPVRLVGQGLATPTSVKAAALRWLGAGALLGFFLAISSSWVLLLVGLAALIAAWTYTGGPKPYGYSGFGELSVFVFFGLVAVMGTTFSQTGYITYASITGAIAVGALACALLVANNLRDISADEASGKTTLAVRLGDSSTRRLYIALIAVAGLATLATVPVTPGVLLAFAAVPVAGSTVTVVQSKARGAALVPVLKDTGLIELIWALGFAAGLLIN
jgi:1,4-dihydroxy-2-naphthoate polyprenyltransferase